ncbi:MAG TPA: cation transporter [Pyrinomonadaceae bacterium]|nr:cation transporter [Pyrinomonadaceae bacterium]
MEKTVFQIPQMDCPSEENLIRLRLDGIAEIKHLAFDIPQRRLTVHHEGRLEAIERSIADLNLGGARVSTERSEETRFEEPAKQRKLLWTVLAINFGFFAIEMTTGLISGSMGLVADSLDMLADAFVYGISLFAVGATLSRKRRIATLAGYFQLALAIVGFVEVVRRFLGVEEMPDSGTMIVVSILALVANGFCLYLLQKSKSNEAHMQASAIFTSNDVIINLGVIAAGVLVYLFGSNRPDLIVGTIVFVVVLRGALRILRLGKRSDG